ncbi:MAG: cysteine synthase family protein [Armatimonadetes bacterium]|nr:cysteine synthase family protein [Armatimonadota bacterium]
MIHLKPVECPRKIPVCLVPCQILDTIGNTPLVPIRSSSERTGCRILAKAEYLNPGGSIKDRIARFIIEEAEKRGDLSPGGTILEVTSGNTGIALSMVGAVKGYRVVIIMPQTVSRERRNMILSFGAELHLIERLTGIQAAVERAIQLAREHQDIFLPSQFSNPDNALCHEKTTGAEIVSQTEGQLDAFVMGVGTGGTLMGVGRALRAAGLQALRVAVEPEESAVLSGGPPGHHGIQGLADGFIPELIRQAEIDQVVRVGTREAEERARQLGAESGLLVGISAGANVIAAERVAGELGPGHTVITVLPDRGERYLSLRDDAMPKADESWLFPQKKS